jgi:hypothetical protein
MREKIYTQNLEKRIDFICKKCKTNMRFMRKPHRIIIECAYCGVYFVVSGEVRAEWQALVRWGNSKREIQND